jgi:hypothetical protein
MFGMVTAETGRAKKRENGAVPGVETTTEYF